MIKKTILLVGAIAIAAVSTSAEVVQYKIDPVHSGVNFKIRHFINKIPGSFTTFQGEIHFDAEAPENSKTTATIQVGSVDTRNEKRDSHLQEDDFFNAAVFPTIEFTSTEWISTGEDTYLVKGLLTMMGVGKPIDMEVTYLGEMEARQNIISGWEGKAKIDRSEWGISGGKPAVGSDVEIEINIQARRQ